MSDAHKELPKGYEPENVEARWRAFWEDNKTFTPDAAAPAKGGAYSSLSRRPTSRATCTWATP